MKYSLEEIKNMLEGITPRESIDYVNNHASDCGCSQRIAHDIRERYGVEE